MAVNSCTPIHGDVGRTVSRADALLMHSTDEFLPDCHDFWREFNRYRFNLGHLLPLIPNGGAVLDIGAGAGVMAHAFKAAGAKVTVVDNWLPYSSEAAAAGEQFMHRMGNRDAILARYSRSGIATVECDIFTDRLPFADASFDLVMLLAVIEHLPGSPQLVLEEARRVLKPGGILAIEVPNIAALRNRLKLLFGRSIHFTIDEWYHSHPFCGHYREMTRQELRWLIDTLGMDLLWLRTSNTAFHNTKHADGHYERRFRFTSLFQAAKALYLLVCESSPALRYQMLATARKPGVSL